MKIRILASALLLPALAVAQVPEKKASKPKPAAIATVNGVAVPQSRADYLTQQQLQRGAQDSEQLRGMVREELVNREILMQEANRIVVRAPIRIDGDDVYAPSQNLYTATGQVIGTPSVRSSVRQDVYLTFEKRPEGDGPASIKVLLVPMVLWLWVGAAVMALGTALCLVPGRRRRPVEPIGVEAELIETPVPATVGADV